MVRWLALATLLPACEQLMPQGEPESTCDISFDTLDGRTFVSVEATPGGVDRLNPVARVKFGEKDGNKFAKYTVASLSDVYELPCELKEKDGKSTLFCAEEPRPTDWCQALLVADQVCSKKVLRKFGATGTDEELNEAIKKAKETWRKYRGTEYEARFILNNNNLGNKLQGRLYVDIDEKRCKLSVGDYYWTIFNGRGVEDTNPVGQNPFAETDKEYLFEHCVEGNIMPGIEAETLPDDLSSIPGRGRRYATGKDYWFHYLGEKHMEPEQGCNYSYDLWANFLKVSEANAVSLGSDKKLDWKAQHAFSSSDQVVMWGDQSKPIGVLTMIRHKECGGKKEQLDVVCEAGLLVEEI